MSIRVTMSQTRLGEAGSLLNSGSTYTVSDEFGAWLIGRRFATDTDALLPAASQEQSRIAVSTTRLAALVAASELVVDTVYVVGTDWFRATSPSTYVSVGAGSTASDTGSTSGGTTLTAATIYYHDTWVVNGGGTVTLAADLASSGRKLAFVPGVGQPDFTIALASGPTVIQDPGTTLSSAEADARTVIVFCQADGVWRVESVVVPSIALPVALGSARAQPDRGKLVCSWQVNPLQSALTGTAYEPSPYPEVATYPQALKPSVYQAYNAGGQCRATAELGEDATATAASFTPSLTPAAVAANTTAEQSFTCTGITTAHRILSVAKTAQQSGLQIVAFRCDAADTLKITYKNTTGSSITPTAAETYTVSTLLATGGQSSLFNSLMVWAKAPRRADGEAYTYARLDLGSDTAFTNRAFTAMMIRADGVWRPYIVTRQQFGAAGTFVMGATRFDYVRFNEAGAATALTLTAAPSAAATSATLTANFGGTTEIYPVRFSNGDVRIAQLINGSTAITWDTGLSSGATTAAVYTTTALAHGATESIQVGPIYRDPVGRPFAYVRFDDSVSDQYTARQTLSAPFVGASGVTLAPGAYSAKDVVSAFGLKGNAFILTSKIDTSGFLTAAQLQELQDKYGWSICFQSHANPASLNNLGLRLMGPFGYQWSTNTAAGIASVDATADTITTTAAHQFLTPSIGPAGLQGQPIEMTGTNLPGGLSTGVKYFPRPTTTTAFTLHPTEADAASNTNRLDLTSTGTPATFGYRFWGSANTTAAIAADFAAGKAAMQAWGLKGWRYYASNQGAMDYATHRVLCSLRASGDLRIYSGTMGNTGEASSSFIARPAFGATSGGFGFAGGGQLGYPTGDVLTFPTNYTSEPGTEQQARDFVDSLIAFGGVGGNYHHFFSTEASLRNLCAYCDQIKLRVGQGLLSTGNMDDLYGRMVASGAVA